MKTLKISGHSDDIIMIEGDITDELYPAGDGSEGDLLAFSDGTILRITYGKSGIWRITPVSHGAAEYHKDENSEDNGDRYSDVVTLTGDIKWVVQGSRFLK